MTKGVKMAVKKRVERPILVTTQHRGVFFGYSSATEGPVVNLKRGRMCVYWSSDLRGVLGLAVMGPGPQCKIGPAIDLQLSDVTMIAEVTPQAAEKWESAPWSV
jgi:hypothetical protein